MMAPAAPLLATSLGICLARYLSVRRAVGAARKAVPPAGFMPPVTILKPLRGVEDGLFDNLESFCRLDYPRYEIIFCLQSPDDPALRIVRKVMERHPDRDISVVLETCRAGFNPKVNNLIPGYARARHPYVLISDSNVIAGPGYLKEAVSHLHDPSVGLVTHLVRGVGGRTLGARLENAHLNTFILGSICLLDRVLDIPCTVGKSMLMRRVDLDALGGLESVKDFLAEDYVLGSKFRRAGKRVVVSAAPVDTVNIYRGVREFLSRHARWNRMRLAIAGPTYGLEVLSNPVFLAVLIAACASGDGQTLLLAGATLAGKVLVDAATNRVLGIRDWRGVILGPLRDLIAAGLWMSGFWSRKVNWRGQALRITRGSRLVAEEGVPPAMPSAGRPGVAAA